MGYHWETGDSLKAQCYMTYLEFASGVLKFVYILFFWALLNRSVKVWIWFVGVFQGFTLLEAMFLTYGSMTLTRWSSGEAGLLLKIVVGWD